MRQIGAAGSPLPPEGYRWVAEHFPGVLLNVGSGGTDVCSGIVQGGPWQPVVEGEISGPALGVAFSDLLVHGWEGRGAQLGSLVGPLVEAGLSVVAFDAPAHGDSPGNRLYLTDEADHPQTLTFDAGLGE